MRSYGGLRGLPGCAVSFGVTIKQEAQKPAFERTGVPVLKRAGFLRRLWLSLMHGRYWASAYSIAKFLGIHFKPLIKLKFMYGLSKGKNYPKAPGHCIISVS